MTHNERIMREYNDRPFSEVPISELQVAGDCKTCFPETRTGAYVIPEGNIYLLSPQGLVHRNEDYGDVTACGKDCTGLGWWHRL